MQPVSLYQQATQIRHNPLSAAQASPAHRDRWDRVLLEVRFCPQTSWNGLCMAYAWPYASWCDFSAIPRVGCIATRANANLGDPLPLHLALPRPPTQNLIGSKYVLQSCPSFATFSYIFQCLLSNLQFCDHPSVLPRHVLGSNCGIPTTRLTSCSSCTDGNNETTRRLMARERRGASYSGVNGVSKNTM